MARLSQHSALRQAAVYVLCLAAVLAVLPASLGQAVGEESVVSFLAPQKATALPLQPLSAAKPQGRAANASTPTERGVPSWGAYVTNTADSDTPAPGPSRGIAILTLSKPDTLSFNISLDSNFVSSDQLQSVLLSVPAFINSSAVTLAALVGHNATDTKLVAAKYGNSTGIRITGDAAVDPSTTFPQIISNLSMGRAVLNIYTAQYPEPSEPMGCCNNAELKTDGSLEPLNAEALPPDGLRQDHHGVEAMPGTPLNSLPFSAVLMPMGPQIRTAAGGVVSMLVAPNNASITYNVSLGGLAPDNEIYNVSVWFGKGAGRKLGWFPYSLYSFASNRLPTPRGGLLAPVNGANFTLATGWVGRFIDASPTLGLSTSGFFNDPTFDFGLQQLLMGNVYIVIGTADHPQGELQGHAVLGWPSSA